MSVERIFPGRSGQTVYQFAGFDVPSDSGAILPALARSEAAPEVFTSPRPVYSLALDPEYTSPGVVMAVRPDAAGWGTVLLRPGEVLQIPGGTYGFRYWNANGPIFDRINAADTAPPVGGVAFLVSHDRSVVVNPRRDLQPRPGVAVIGVGNMVANAPADGFANLGGVCIPGGSSLLRLTVFPIGAANALIAAPADFAATVRLFVCGELRSLTAGPGTMAAALLNRIDDLGRVLPGRWVAVDGDLAFTQAGQAITFTPPPGAILLCPRYMALAGAAVVGLWFHVSAAG